MPKTLAAYYELSAEYRRDMNALWSKYQWKEITYMQYKNRVRLLIESYDMAFKALSA